MHTSMCGVLHTKPLLPDPETPSLLLNDCLTIWPLDARSNDSINANGRRTASMMPMTEMTKERCSPNRARSVML